GYGGYAPRDPARDLPPGYLSPADRLARERRDRRRAHVGLVVGVLAGVAAPGAPLWGQTRPPPPHTVGRLHNRDRLTRPPRPPGRGPSHHLGDLSPGRAARPPPARRPRPPPGRAVRHRARRPPPRRLPGPPGAGAGGRPRLRPPVHRLLRRRRHRGQGPRGR